MSTTANTLRILVMRRRIAGNSVALQLLRAGIAVTVVERATSPGPAARPSICAVPAAK